MSLPICAYAQPSTSAKSQQASRLAPLHIVTRPLEKTAQAHEIYYLKLLQLVLKKTEPTDGPFILEQSSTLLSSKRYIAEVTRENGAIDVIWTMIDHQREQDLLPIKISLLRGMNSYRTLLIRAEDKDKFSHIKTLEELKKYNAGSGSAWPDTAILKRNGLPVVTSAHYELLFTMLARKRFDYFPRGIHEAWNEKIAQADKNFIIEDRLLLHYPAPMYFFVNKKNTRLADRIYRGLKLAIADGSFDALFFSIPGFRQSYDEMHNPARTIFHLKSDGNYED